MAALLLLRPSEPDPSWRLEHLEVPRRLARALEARSADPRALGHVAAMLSFGAPPAAEALHPGLAGPRLALALLAPRAQAVYRAGAAPWPEDDVEHVHELRVATRRLREALAVAAPLLPRGALARANRRARDLGRTLGERRTVDVLLEDLTELGRAAGPLAPSFADFLRARRDQATARIRSELPPERLRRHGLRTLELALRAFDVPGLSALAGPHLEARLEDAEARLGAIEAPEAVEHHHRLRIALKHLRYAVEIFAGPWPALFPPEQTVAPLKRLQDALGVLNDAQELLTLARAHRAERPGEAPEVDRLIVDLGELTLSRYEAARATVRDTAGAVLARVRETARALGG